MARISTFKDVYWDFYELHALEKHIVTAGEDTGDAIVITGVQAHAVAEADIEYTRAYIDGVLTPVVSVAEAIGDTTITFSTLTEGETVDITFPITGAGSLVSNTSSGKLTRPPKQVARAWNVEETTIPLMAGGTGREEDVEVNIAGSAMLRLQHKGNMAMADFEKARDGKSNGDPIYLLIDVVNTTEATDTHILLHKAQVMTCGKASAAEGNISGILTDTVELSFEPDAVPL